MTKWIILITLIISGSILGYMYHEMQKISADNAKLATLPDPSTVKLIDGYKDGVHRISGVIKLPHSCFSVKTDSAIDPEDKQHVTITLSTVDLILDQPICAHIRTQYPFETIVETQKEITVTLVIDGDERPVTVSQTDWQNPSGNIINTQPLP